jgi:uncharacterized protein
VERVLPFVSGDEVRNCLLASRLRQIQEEPHRSASADLFWAESNGGVVGVALRDPRPLLLSAGLSQDAAAAIAERVSSTLPALEGWTGPSEAAERFAAAWMRVRECHAELQNRTSMLEFEAAVRRPPVTGDLRHYREEDRDLLVGWLRMAIEELGLLDAHTQPEDAVEGLVEECVPYLWWDEGRPVSMAGVGKPSLHGGQISKTYTPPEFRRRGYASSCLSAVSLHLLASGCRFCFLISPSARPVCEALYARSGYAWCGDIDSWVVR